MAKEIVIRERPDELYHYGRKGMKWYQNIYTSAKTSNANRKAKKQAKRAAETEKKNQKIASERAARIKAGKMKPRDMTDDELKVHTARLQLEKNYSDALKASKQYNHGKKFVEQYKDEVITKLAKDVGADLTSQIAKALLVEGTNKTMNKAGIGVTTKKDKETGEMLKEFKEMVFSNNKKNK